MYIYYSTFSQIVNQRGGARIGTKEENAYLQMIKHLLQRGCKQLINDQRKTTHSQNVQNVTEKNTI